jgi:hypothetical protein
MTSRRVSSNRPNADHRLSTRGNQIAYARHAADVPPYRSRPRNGVRGSEDRISPDKRACIRKRRSGRIVRNTYEAVDTGVWASTAVPVDVVPDPERVS